eukprot:1157000-Pelagomonas_calceolata.AAC.5
MKAPKIKNTHLSAAIAPNAHASLTAVTAPVTHATAMKSKRACLPAAVALAAHAVAPPVACAPMQGCWPARQYNTHTQRLMSSKHAKLSFNVLQCAPM